MIAENLPTVIDHTLLKADATNKQIASLCQEASHYNFFAVCVNSSHVALASSLLSSSVVRVVSTAGFPLGASSLQAKLCETEQAIDDGAHEVDLVINVGCLKAAITNVPQKKLRNLSAYASALMWSVNLS